MMTGAGFNIRLRPIAAALLAAAATQAGRAQIRADQTPRGLEDVKIEQKLEARIPLGLEFIEDSGKKIRLGKYFNGERPVILTLNYYRCPQICDIQLNELVRAIDDLKWTAGQEFEIVTLSFDPLEGVELARNKKKGYLAEYGRPEAARGWHFLTGKRAEIKALTSTVGFGYLWNEKRQEWAHETALIVCTPDGRVSRYLGGLMYEPRDVRLALFEASEGKIGSFIEQIFLRCYVYHPDTGYVLVAWRIMRVFAALTLLILSAMIFGFWRYEVRRRKAFSATVQTSA